jgi:MFS family permease
MKNKSLKILFIYNGIFVFAANLLGPLYAVYVGMLDNNIFSISATWAVGLLATSIFTFAISKKGDLLKEKEYLLLAGFLIRAIAWFLYIGIGNIFQLALLQILLGLGEAAGSPAFNAIFAEHLDSGKQIREYSNWMIFSNILTAAGTVAGGFVASVFGFHWLFAGMGVLALVSFFGILIQPRKLL